MSTQIPLIFDPNNKFFYDDLLEMCAGSHRREDVIQAISASVAYITTKSGMWIRKKEARDGSIYFEFAPDLKGISPQHRVKIQSGSNDEDENISTTSHKLRDLLQQASIKRIRYCDVDFMPYPPNAPQINAKFFNLFLGFKAQPAPEIDRRLINPILRHILEVWCDNNKELAKYISNWLAFLVQKPDQKPGTAILMRSPPRCGKNILTDFIGEKVLGRENFFSTTRLHDVMGRFNGAIRAKKLIVLNECDMTGSEWHGANNQLKGLITEPYVSIEEKGIDTKVINDFAGFMILSNHAMPIRIELGDERYIALDVSARYKGNRDYFTSLVRLLNHPNTASSFMAWLLSRNIDDWNPRDLPNTKMKQDLIEASMPNPQRFMLEYVDTYWPENAEPTQEIPCTKFYGIYASWCQDNGEPKVLSSNKFGMEIKQFVTKTRPRSENRIPHYKLNRKEIVDKFNESLGKISEVQMPSSQPAIEENKVEKKEEVTELETIPVAFKEAPKKKSPPPLPPKSEGIKVRVKLLKSESIKKAPEPEIDPASIPLPESPKLEPVPKVISASVPKPYGIPGPSKPVIYTEEEKLYNSIKELWERYDGDPNDFDWEICAIEIENLSNCTTNADQYHNELGAIMRSYQYKAKKGVGLTSSFCKETAQEIREYEKKKETVPVLFNVPSLTIESSSIIKHTKETFGIDCDGESDDDEELESLWD
jgi:phage/plasmid-associated DNA primase